MSSLCSLKPSRDTFKLMEMQSYSTTYQRNWNENHNFVANLYEARQEPYFKGTVISSVFFKLPKTLGEFFTFSIGGLPYCKPFSLPEERSELVGCFLTTQTTACKAAGRAGLPCLPEGDVGLGEYPHLWQEGVTETSIKQMKPRWKLKRVANAVLVTLVVHLRYYKPQTNSLYTLQSTNKCDQTTQSF